MARGTGLSSLQCLQRGGFDAQVGGLEALGGRHHVFWLLVRGARPANTAGKKTRSEEKEKKKVGERIKVKSREMKRERRRLLGLLFVDPKPIPAVEPSAEGSAAQTAKREPLGFPY